MEFLEKVLTFSTAFNRLRTSSGSIGFKNIVSEMKQFLLSVLKLIG